MKWCGCGSDRDSAVPGGLRFPLLHVTVAVDAASVYPDWHDAINVCPGVNVTVPVVTVLMMVEPTRIVAMPDVGIAIGTH